MVTTYHLEKNIVQRQGDQLKGKFNRIYKLRGSMLTKIFPVLHNTGHYCEKAKVQRAQSPLRSQLSFETCQMEASRQAAAAGGPSPQDELWALSAAQSSSSLAGWQAGSALTQGMQPFLAPAEKKSPLLLPFDFLLLSNW